MIRFSCKCGHEFNVTDDRVGQMTQCPRCGLLVDVPSTEELPWMDAAGVLAVDGAGGDDDGPRVPGQTLAEMYRAYGRRRTDAAGVPLDLRHDVERLRRVGEHEDPNAAGYRPERIAPRYDPETGERILPLSLKDEPPRAVVPVARHIVTEDGEVIPLAELVEEPPPAPKRPPVSPPPARPGRRPAAGPTPVVPIPVEPVPVAAIPVEPMPVMAIPVAPLPVAPLSRSARTRQLTYAVGDSARPTTLPTLAVDLLARPANVFVLFFVGLFYFGAFALKVPLNAFGYLLGLPPLALQLINFPLLALAAHYGCVVEDLGPNQIDELPRPLRNFAIGDDLFAPAVRVIAALALCYAPAVAAGVSTDLATPRATAVTLSLAALGTYFFPAVLLTLLTGSTVLNLTPFKVLGVIRDCGGQYALSALMAGLSMVGTAGLLLGPSTLPFLGRLPRLGWAGGRLDVVIPGLFATMYVTHAFAWHLGLMYRAHHESFPWIGQRHVRLPQAVVR